MKRTCLIIASMIVFFVLVVGILEANLITIDVVNTDTPPLQVTIKSDKQVYVMGESINIEYSAKNVSKQDALINKHFLVGSNLFFEFTDERGRKGRSGASFRLAAFWTFTDDEHMVLLRPGEVLTGNVVQKLFPLFDHLKKGKWEMRALIDVFTRSNGGKPELFCECISNTISIEVKGTDKINFKVSE